MRISTAFTVTALLSAVTSSQTYAADQIDSWITTWAASPGPRWTDEIPAPMGVPETLENQTIRQVVRVSAGGNRVRVELSNEFGVKPLTIGAASVALAADEGATKNPVSLTWSGKSNVVIPVGATALSDEVGLQVDALESIAVSIYLSQKTSLSSVHWDGVQTAYVSGAGNFVDAEKFDTELKISSRVFLTAVLVDATPQAQSIVFFGDSITDGNCSTINANRRWPDRVAERLQEAGFTNVSVANEAYSGNRLLKDGMGVNALRRLDDDVLSHSQVSTVVLMMGINDIGWPGVVALTDTQQPAFEDIIFAYRQIVDRVHLHGARVIGATLTPFEGAFKGGPLEKYYSPEKEKTRVAVNEWIRNAGVFDGVLDFDRVVQDPGKLGSIRSEYDCGDHLHPNDAGYRAMADSVDLELLTVRPD